VKQATDKLKTTY